MNPIGVRPLVDFELLAKRNARENDDLRRLRQSLCDPSCWNETRLEALDQIGGYFLSWGAGKDPDWDVGIELS